MAKFDSKSGDLFPDEDNFNGGYIKASQEAYDLLIEAGYVPNKLEVSNLHTQYLRVTNNMIMYVNGEHAKYLELKQFYINNGVLSWDEPKDVNNIEDYIDRHEAGVYDVPIQINNMEDLNELPILRDEITLKEILQDVQDKQMSVHASELLIKAIFKIKE